MEQIKDEMGTALECFVADTKDVVLSLTAPNDKLISGYMDIVLDEKMVDWLINELTEIKIKHFKSLSN